MEQHPRDPGDRKHNIPEPERLSAGEIDLTGSIEQEDDLRDVIGDALVEAQAADGELPEWGARTLARALANRLDDPHSGALHHFAVTGRVDKEAILRELGGIHDSASDEETADWTLLLGMYISDVPDMAPAPAAADATQEPEPDNIQTNEAEPTLQGSGPTSESTQAEQRSRDHPGHGNEAPRKAPAAQFTEYLQQTAAHARARGEAISHDDARQVAQMLAGFLVIMDIKDPAMIRLAETGEVDRPKLENECQQLKAVKWKLPDIHIWVEHLEQYLSQRAEPDRPVEASAEKASDSPQVAEGIREHGDAFRAFLALPDVKPDQADLLTRFREVYVGAYDSMETLTNDLTDVQACKAKVYQVAASWGYEGFFIVDQELLEALVRATWDIVEYGGRFYAFSK